MCTASLDWDQALPEDLLKKWYSLGSTLNEAQSVFIPRCYKNRITDTISTTLCGFCDASLKAQAVVVYLRLEATTGFIIQFVASKTKVSPLQGSTIPRLELLFALLLARLLHSITQSLEADLHLSSPHCFTDFKVALCWIKGTDECWKSFIQIVSGKLENLFHQAIGSTAQGMKILLTFPLMGLLLLSYQSVHFGTKETGVAVRISRNRSRPYPFSSVYQN